LANFQDLPEEDQWKRHTLCIDTGCAYSIVCQAVIIAVLVFITTGDGGESAAAAVQSQSFGGSCLLLALGLAALGSAMLPNLEAVRDLVLQG
jgi:hypothetical protein